MVSFGSTPGADVPFITSQGWSQKSTFSPWQEGLMDEQLKLYELKYYFRENEISGGFLIVHSNIQNNRNLI